jgi:hypothetical protein
MAPLDGLRGIQYLDRVSPTFDHMVTDRWTTSVEFSDMVLKT